MLDILRSPKGRNFLIRIDLFWNKLLMVGMVEVKILGFSEHGGCDTVLCILISNILQTSVILHGPCKNDPKVDARPVITSVSIQIYCRCCRLVLALAGPLLSRCWSLLHSRGATRKQKFNELYFTRYYDQYLKINSSSAALALKTVPLPHHKAQLLIRCTGESCFHHCY